MTYKPTKCTADGEMADAGIYYIDEAFVMHDVEVEDDLGKVSLYHSDTLDYLGSLKRDGNRYDLFNEQDIRASSGVMSIEDACAKIVTWYENKTGYPDNVPHTV